MTRSPLDRPLQATFFPDHRAFKKKDVKITLREFAKIIRDTSAPSKEQLPWVKLARFDSDKTEHGSLRSNANMLAFDGIEVDYDGGRITIEDAAERARREGIAALLYESPSSTPEKPRWRGMLPTSETLPPDERTYLVERINGVFDGELDQQASFTLSQAFLYGGIEGKPPLHTILIEGDYIDLADDLDAHALHKGRSREGKGERDESNSGAAYRKAKELCMNGGTIEEFETWAEYNTWNDYERNAERALQKTWGAAERDVEADQQRLVDMFDNLGELDRKGDARPKSTLRSYAMGDLAHRAELFDFVEDVLYDGQLSVVVGAPKVGKTFFVLDLCLHIATGRPWHGREVDRGAVLYVALEGIQGIKRRIEAWCIRNKVDPDSLPLMVASGSLDLRKDKATRRWIIEQAAELARNTGLSVKMIVIDTLNRAIGGGNENSPEDMGAFVAGADQVRIETSAHTMVIHHPGKDESKGLRGHTSLLGALDTQIDVEAGRRGRSAVVQVQKEGEPGAIFGFTLEKVSLNYKDRRGRPVTSMVAVADASATFDNLDDDGLGKRERAALRVLERIIGRARIIDGENAAHLDDWRAALHTVNWPEADMKASTFRSAFSRAQSSLESKIEIDKNSMVRLRDGN